MLLVAWPGWLETAELKLYDWRMRTVADIRIARKMPLVNPDIVLVEITDAAIRDLSELVGRWPWPRAVHGTLIDYISSGQPKAIAVDLTLLEPERESTYKFGDGQMTTGSPDAVALQGFLKARRAAEPDTFEDLSLGIIKLLGRGEYVAEAPSEPSLHFALATQSYTHSTAPNRRFPDLVTQRLLKAAIAGSSSPYALPELRRLAEHCTKQEDAANKVERLTRKAAAALWLTPRIGETFDSIRTTRSGEQYQILDSSDGWYRVRLPEGTEAWVSSAFVKAIR